MSATAGPGELRGGASPFLSVPMPHSPEPPAFSAEERDQLRVALGSTWSRLGLPHRLGCPSAVAADYFLQHLDASLPYLQRLGRTRPDAVKATLAPEAPTVLDTPCLHDHTTQGS